MVDTIEDYKKFLEKNKFDDLFLHVMYLDEHKHPNMSFLCVILVLNIKTSELYHFVINHQDSAKIIDILEFVQDINKFNGRVFVLDKKSIIQHLPLVNILDINLGLYLEDKKIINISEFQTNAHSFIYQKYYTYSSLNKVVPLVKHREMVCKIFSKIKNVCKSLIFNEEYFLKINTEIINPLAETEKNGIFVDQDKFKSRFDGQFFSNDGFVFSQYNLYTLTGRPSNRFGGVNYSALNKDDGSRECFISRFGKNGLMMMIDYSAFHHRIICSLMNFKLPKDIDFYYYLAKLCFKKNIIDAQDLIDVKSLSWKQLYGGVEEKYSHIQYFYNLKNFINEYWKEFENKGYVVTPIFNRKITKNHIQDPNPNKLFNYILQATETEIAVPLLGIVNGFLKDKKSKAVLYTYDSILFDVHNSELNLMKKDVVDIMMDKNKFPVKCYVGDTYGSLKLISL